MSRVDRLDLSQDGLDLTFSLDRGLVVEHWKGPSTRPWIDPTSPLFAATIDGRRFDAHSPGARVRAARVDRAIEDRTHAVITIDYEIALQIELHFVVYPDTALVEQWITLQNTSVQRMRVDRLDSFALHLLPGACELLSFSSGWGAEFEGIRGPVDGPVVLESRSGRSSNGMSPFFVLSHGEEKLSASVAWSGNWVMRLDPDATGYAVTGGLHDWEFFSELLPGGGIEAPHGVIALATGTTCDVAQQYHRVGRRHWYPENRTSRSLPVEWNQWWSYEDQAIDEKTFRANIEVAAGLGLELCTLDAGWFGPSDADAAWTDYRGDWARVNEARFPSGIRTLSDHAHAHGLLFGLWCEIEALGGLAELRKLHPEFEAMRNGIALGYACFGSPDVQAWALLTLERLVTECRCDWIKLDFNVDPGAGCNRLDHGHGPGDGLFAHYRGYYTVLSTLRSNHPAVVLENCSSGGLRTDLGIMRQTHTTFLSDPDWPEHNLQVFWGATMLLAPEVCLHWGLSQWLTPHPHQTFDPHDPALTQRELDYHIRTALLGAAGVSLRLPDLPPWVAARVAFHARLYKQRVRRFVLSGRLYRLTDQPRRDGRGDRWCAFQYSLPREHLLFVFRLPGAEATRVIVPRALEERRYRLNMVDDNSVWWREGRDLMREGIHVDWLDERNSAIITLSEEHPNE